MNIDLSNKVALVTGGSSGIGREIVFFLARAKAAVIINHLESQANAAQELKDELTSRGSKAFTVRADISKPDEVSLMFDYIKSEQGRLDIMVNNAGIVKESLMLTLKLSDWDRVHDVNMKGTFLCSQHAAEMMMIAGSGKIINIASVTALRGSGKVSSYASSKGGIISFTRSCASELAGKSIQVNAILPGIITTDMSKRAIKVAGSKILKRTPQGEYGTPEDVAGLAVFLASDKSDYITGQAISVDGGVSIAS